MNTPIYKILQSIMNEQRLTVAETARICGLPDSTVRGIITRKQKSVALEVAFKLSKGLKVSLEYLNGDNKKSPTPEREANASNVQECIEKTYGESAVEAVSLYAQLDPGDQGEIRGEMKQMLKAGKYRLEKGSPGEKAM